MDLKGTQTEKNLLLAYTGESLNRNLYTYFAYKAKDEGYEQIAAIFLETADHEHQHGKQELDFLQTSDIELPTAVYPLKGVGDTLSNLETAVSGEHYEQSIMYPDFAEKADEEGFPHIAQILRHIATVEAYHEERFRALLNNMKEGKVFRRQPAVKWKCRACGYVKEDQDAPHICPVCGYGRAYFEVLAEIY
ncbi:MAG: rubrerythrin [Desulfatiglandales bacterium]